MHNLRRTAFALICALLSFTAMASLTSPAQAKFTDPFKSNFETVFNDCANAHGVLTEDPGGYGCTKANCDGKGGMCSVACDNDDNCIGSTPGKIHLSTVTGYLLNGGIVNHDYLPFDDTGTPNHGGSVMGPATTSGGPAGDDSTPVLQ